MGYTWYGIKTRSIERLQFTMGRKLQARSIITSREGRCDYEATLDGQWVFRELTLRCHDDRRLEVQRRSDGTWSVNGQLRPDLEGAIDIDLAFSPFTNTLPVRRLNLAIGSRAEITTAYIDVPSLRVLPDPQAYTRTSVNLYLYESLDSDFNCQIKVDPDGFIIDYPGLYTRGLPPG
ncbi:putative glycolipid-binding domain-containing protein [Arthrobacter sp. SAFR-044]|uniref:putative glycolipid-binding domain-containing protein n=1 Tax=Arthrobacter sp. SAFR-044 TaxID=3387278 RepID=UPI003F7B5107